MATKKIVNIIGGIGNQMFQYAFAIALKHRYPEEHALIDISHFKHYNLHSGFELQRVFNIKLPIAQRKDITQTSYYIPHYTLSRFLRRILPRKKTEYIEKAPYCYDSQAQSVTGDCYFEGYWQSPKYFDKVVDGVCEAFEFPEICDPENIELSNMISEDNSITVHVRRGDYVNAPNFKDICTLNYYSNALVAAQAKIKNPRFFIFSNDITWCKEHIIPFIQNHEVRFVDCNKDCNSYRDMQLISLGRCCIIANSSFSWWGAWLNKRQDKIVIAPSRWVNSTNSKDIYPEGWILL